MAEVDISEFKYSTLTNPETCPIEELEKQVSDLELTVSFYDTKQLAIKKFINSVYGALGSKYFVAHNTAMAESITAQGRDLNHFSENSVNRYLKGIFQSNPKITLWYQWVHYGVEADGEEKKWTFESKDKPDDYYMTGKWEECKQYAGAVKKGKKLTAEMKDCLRDNSVGHCDWFMTSVDLWTKLGMNDAQKEKAKTFDITKGMTRDTGELVGPEFSYLDGTRSAVVGGDTDSIYSGYVRLMINFNEIREDFSENSEEIVVKYANMFDVFDEDENVITLPIEELYQKLKYINDDSVLVTDNGSRVIPSKYVYAETYDSSKNEITWKPINYIMGHRISKPKFKIKSKSGKEIIVTGDHSCMVMRNGELITVKAQDIDVKTDKLVTIKR